MKIRHLVPLILGFNLANSQEKDTIKTYNLEEIVVTAEQKNEKKEMHKEGILKAIHSNDSFKQLTDEPGVTTSVPIFSNFNVDRLPFDQFGGLWLENIRIAGRTTQLQGVYSIINPDLYDLELERFYSVRYDDIGSIIKINPRKNVDRKIGIKAYSDLLERIVTISYPLYIKEIDLNGNHNLSLRSIKTVGIERLVEELKLLPEVLELEYYLTTNFLGEKFEINFRKSSEKNNYNSGDKTGISKIDEESSQDLFILKNKKEFNGLNLISMFGYEFDKLNSTQSFQNTENEIDLGTKNINLAFELEDKNHIYSFGLNTYFMRTNNFDKNKDIDVVRLWGEYNLFFNDVLIKPSLGITESREKILALYGSNFSYIKKEFEFTLSFNHIANFLVHNNGLIGSIFDNSKELNPQVSNNYFFLIALNEENKYFNRFEFSGYRKDFNADFRGDYSKGFVQGMDFSISKEGNLYYSINSSISKSEINNHPLPGAIDKTLQLSFGKEFFDAIYSITQFTYQDGIYYKNREKDNYEKFDPSIYLNHGFKLKLFDDRTNLTFTIYNLLNPLGRKNQAGVIKNPDGTYKPIYVPVWFNLGGYYKF